MSNWLSSLHLGHSYRRALLPFGALPVALSFSLLLASGLTQGAWGKEALSQAPAKALPTTLEEQLQGHVLPMIQGSLPATKPVADPATRHTMGDEAIQLDTSSAKAKSAVVEKSEPITAKAVVVDINSNTLNYDEAKGTYTALGNVHLMVSEQNSELIADKVTYDQANDIVIAEGKVTIIKHGKKTHGVYAKIDLKRESALISDAVTKVEGVRVLAKSALVDPNMTHLEDGKLILTNDLLAAASGISSAKAKLKKTPATGSAPQANAVLATTDTTTSGQVAIDKVSPKVQPLGQTKTVKGQVNKTAKAPEYMGENPLSSMAGQAHQELSNEMLDLNDSASQQSNWHLKAKTIDITRNTDGIADLHLDKPTLYYKNHKIARLVTDEFAYNEETGEIDYLGPDIGYDPDYGGFYYGPGWDTRVGKGFLRVSPVLSYGGAGRRRRGGSRFEDQGVGAGAGIVGHYRDENLLIDAAYNSRVEQPVLWLDRKLLDGKTHFQIGVNQDYTNGFLSFERPGFVAQITDTRKVFENKWARIDTFGSIGVAKDDFFPNNERNFFVDPTQLAGNQGKTIDELEPATAGRIQLQAQIRNPKPIFKKGTWFRAGYVAQLAAAGYSTGDLAALFRFGPTVNFRYKNRLSSGLRYMYAFSGGESPFIFDSYYLGRQALNINNSVRINDFLSVGAWHILSLNRDNAQESMFTGNALYALAGPKSVKFNVAYDFVRKRSYFGVNFYPTGKETVVDFDNLNMVSPTNFMPQVAGVSP